MGVVMEKIVVAGPVILKGGKVLLIIDEDGFYKLPGGHVESGETGEDACRREAREEIGADITIRQKLSTMYLNKSPRTGLPKRIELQHYLSDLNNPHSIRPFFPVKEIAWLDIADLKRGTYDVAPNVRYLIRKGQIK